MRKLSHEYEDNSRNSARAPQSDDQAPDLSGPGEVVLCLSSMKSIVSWPSKCNFPLLSALSSLRD